MNYFTYISHGSETLPIVDKQTYLGIEITSSGRYTYARDILSKKAYKVFATAKRLFSSSERSTITIKNKLFDTLVKPILLYGCEIWGPELLSYKTHFDKSTIEQVHIKFYSVSLANNFTEQLSNLLKLPSGMGITGSFEKRAPVQICTRHKHCNVNYCT